MMTTTAKTPSPRHKKKRIDAPASALPADLIGEVVALLEPADASAAAAVCREWRDAVAGCAPLWARSLRQRYGERPGRLLCMDGDGGQGDDEADSRLRDPRGAFRELAARWERARSSGPVGGPLAPPPPPRAGLTAPERAAAALCEAVLRLGSLDEGEPSRMLVLRYSSPLLHDPAERLAVLVGAAFAAASALAGRAVCVYASPDGGAGGRTGIQGSFPCKRAGWRAQRRPVRVGAGRSTIVARRRRRSVPNSGRTVLVSDYAMAYRTTPWLFGKRRAHKVFLCAAGRPVPAELTAHPRSAVVDLA